MKKNVLSLKKLQAVFLGLFVQLVVGNVVFGQMPNDNDIPKEPTTVANSYIPSTFFCLQKFKENPASPCINIYLRNPQANLTGKSDEVISLNNSKLDGSSLLYLFVVNSGFKVFEINTSAPNYIELNQAGSNYNKTELTLASIKLVDWKNDKNFPARLKQDILNANYKDKDIKVYSIPHFFVNDGKWTLQLTVTFKDLMSIKMPKMVVPVQ